MSKGFNVEFDTSDFDKGMDKLDSQIDKWWREAREQMADSLLLISRLEVPHDTGFLQASGHVFYDFGEDSWNVAYNTSYASYVHEGMRRDGSHVIRNYQKGRKAKYLEDPLKLNFSTFEQKGRDYIATKLQGTL
jgi:hypothetical protein